MTEECKGDSCTLEIPKSSEATFNTILKGDPTRTLSIRNRFVREIDKRFNWLKRELKEAIVDNDVFGLENPNIVNQATFPGQFAFPNSSDKIRAFMDWLEKMVQLGVLEQSNIPTGRQGLEDAWTNMYIRQAYQKGILRGRMELIKAARAVKSSSQFLTIEQSGGLAAVSNQPFHMNKVRSLYARTFLELKGVTQAMNQQMGRFLSDGLDLGSSPALLSGILIDRVDKIGKTRGGILARTEVVRAHHFAVIQEYKQAGIKKVGVLAEWVTAGFNVCPICSALEGKVFKIEKIESMIPRHPRCRCVALPIVSKE